MEEQKAGLESEDCGRSEEAAEALLRRLDGVDVELENQRRIVAKLQEDGASLQHLRHPIRWTQPSAYRIQPDLLVLKPSVHLSQLPHHRGSPARPPTLRRPGATLFGPSQDAGGPAPPLCV